MTWWILGSLPFGAAFMLTFPRGTLPFLITVMILESAHVVSPMVNAWTKPGLRAIVRREWVKHIAAPVVIMAGITFVPIWITTVIYMVWNSFHFGMQNFGVATLYGWRRLGFVLLCVTMLCMSVAPLLYPHSVLLLGLLGALSFNHWMVDIGLSSRVARWHWGFLAAVLAFGAIWLLLRQGPLSVRVVPQIIAIRYGVGIIHFIYSARVWQLSDPLVRATVGRELFA